MRDESLHNWLEYDPKTGVIAWKVKCGSRGIAGAMAGTVTPRGYRVIVVNKKKYRGHRLAWFLHYGAWPEREIDHINQIKTDNRIENLRDVDHSTNGRNNSGYKNNTTGVTGVYIAKQTGRYVARISTNGLYRALGSYATLLEAAAVRKSAENSIYER